MRIWNLIRKKLATGWCCMPNMVHRDAAGLWFNPQTRMWPCSVSLNSMHRGSRTYGFRMRANDKTWFISIDTIIENASPTLCAAFSALTGCEDTTSSMSGVGKQKSLSILKNNHEHQKALSEIGKKYSSSSSSFGWSTRLWGSIVGWGHSCNALCRFGLEFGFCSGCRK